FFLNEAGAAERVAFGVIRIFAVAVNVGIRHVGHAGNERRKAAALLRLGGGQRKRAHGASMERSVEGDDVLALGVITRELQGALNRFRAGVAVIDFMRAGHGGDLRQPLGKGNHAFIIKIGTRHVDEFGGLLLDGGDDFGMTVPSGCDGDAGGEIEEVVTVHVGDNDAASAFRYERIGTGVGRRNIFFVSGEHAGGVGAGKSGLDAGADESLGSHGILQRFIAGRWLLVVGSRPSRRFSERAKRRAKPRQNAGLLSRCRRGWDAGLKAIRRENGEARLESAASTRADAYSAWAAAWELPSIIYYTPG